MILLKLFYYFCYLFIFCHVSCQRTRLDCSNDNFYSLKPSELVFFQSPNFPKSMNNEDYNNCKFNFTGDENYGYKNPQIIFVLTNGILDNFEIYYDSDKPFLDTVKDIYTVDYFVHNGTDIAIKTRFFDDYYDTHLTPTGYNAFQGYVLLNEGPEDCLLASISSAKKAFEFENDDQILYIQSSFNQSNNITCFWSFSAPLGYGFKISILPVQIGTGFKAVDSIGHVIVDSEIESNFTYPFYNTNNRVFGNQLHISYAAPPMSIYQLKAQISIEKSSWMQNNVSCVWKNFTTFYILSNIEYGINDGYPNYGYCSFNVTVPKDLVFFATITVLTTERNGDILKFTTATEDVIVEEAKTYVFQQNLEGLYSWILWEFITDGSIQYLGFEVKIEILECKCANRTIEISCGAQANYDGYPLIVDSDHRYCGNLECIFEVKPALNCSDKFLLLKISVYSAYGTLYEGDKFEIISDNLLLSSSKTLPIHYSALLPSHKNNTIRVITAYTNFVRKFSMFFTLVDAPKVVKSIILTSAKPSAYINFLNIPKNSMVKIYLDAELIENDETLLMYQPRTSSLYDDISIFKDDNFQYLDVSAINEGSPKHPLKFDAGSANLTIYLHSSYLQPFPLFFKSSKSQSKNCTFSETVFSSTYPDPVQVTAMAKENGPCEIIILEENIYSHLWTTASQEDPVKWLTPLGIPMLEFDSKTAPSWTTAELKLPYSIIQIPPLKSISMIFDNEHIHDIPIIKSDSSLIITTPCFENPNSLCQLNDVTFEWKSYILQDITVIVTTKFFNISQNGLLYIIEDDGNNRYNFTGQNQSFEFFNTTIHLHYKEESGSDYQGAILILKTVDPIMNTKTTRNDLSSSQKTSTTAAATEETLNAAFMITSNILYSIFWGIFVQFLFFY